MTRPTRRMPMVLTLVVMVALSTGGSLSGGSTRRAQGDIPGGVLDFATGLAGAGGTVTWTGGDAPLIGTDIRVGVLTAVDTPISPAPALVGPATPGWGVLSFSTGPHVEFNETTGLHRFSGAGSLTITGTVADAGITTPVTLFSGDLSDATIGPNGQINLGLVEGRGASDANLLSFVGLPPEAQFSISTFFMTTGPAVSGEAFTRTVTSTEMAAPRERYCRYAITAVPATCQIGRPPAVGTIICAKCPANSNDCPTLPGGGLCTIKSAPIRGLVNFLCAGVTLGPAPQLATCENSCAVGDVVAGIPHCP